eukprot:403355346
MQKRKRHLLILSTIMFACSSKIKKISINIVDNRWLHNVLACYIDTPNLQNAKHIHYYACAIANNKLQFDSSLSLFFQFSQSIYDSNILLFLDMWTFIEQLMDRFVIYALYHCESIVKAEIVRSYQIEKMNEDLKNLLINLPLPILLLDPDTQEVQLANNELFRLMSIPEDQTFKDINSRLQEKIFQPFNYIEGLGDQDIQYNQNKSNSLEQRLNLFETINRPYIEDEVFQLETAFDFQNQNFLVNQGNACESEQKDQQEIQSQKYSEIFTIKQQGMGFQNKKLKLILFHRITSFIKYEKLKMEKNFYEMITATVSHDMRTPINAITGMINNLEYFMQLLNFKVNDTGVGVPKEDEEKLFKLFGKLETSKKLNTKGIGLGLNICKKIVEACGGTIFLDTTYKQGASFCFSIQAFKEKKVARKFSQMQLTQYKQNKNQQDDQLTNIIDNQELFQSLYMSVNESLIERADFDYYTSNQGLTQRKLIDNDQPLALLDQTSTINLHYKIIFMDCNMPIMDGFEATKAIRKLQSIDQQQTYIIALTANTNDSIKIQCLDAGMDDFLTKPVSAASIKDILQKYKILQ